MTDAANTPPLTVGGRRHEGDAGLRQQTFSSAGTGFDSANLKVLYSSSSARK